MGYQYDYVLNGVPLTFPNSNNEFNHSHGSIGYFVHVHTIGSSNLRGSCCYFGEGSRAFSAAESEAETAMLEGAVSADVIYSTITEEVCLVNRHWYFGVRTDVKRRMK